MLHVREVSVTSLRRVGRHGAGEPYFGRHAANRFDDPHKRYGTCYCGLQLDTAIAETVLHDEIPEKGQFRIRQEDMDARYLVTFAAGAEDVVFDRARKKFGAAAYAPLANVRGLGQAKTRLGIVCIGAGAGP